MTTTPGPTQPDPDTRTVIPVPDQAWGKRLTPPDLAAMIERADTLADACDDLARALRPYDAFRPITVQLADAHALLVAAGNALAAQR